MNDKILFDNQGLEISESSTDLHKYYPFTYRLDKLTEEERLLLVINFFGRIPDNYSQWPTTEADSNIIISEPSGTIAGKIFSIPKNLIRLK